MVVMRYFRSVLVLAAITAAMAAGAAEVLMRAPARDEYPTLNPGGETVLPNGRRITPSGEMFRVRPHPTV